MISTCQACGAHTEIRLGVCLPCANMERIIREGVDLTDRGLFGTPQPAKTSLERLIFLRRLLGLPVGIPLERRQ